MSDMPEGVGSKAVPESTEIAVGDYGVSCDSGSCGSLG